MSDPHLHQINRQLAHYEKLLQYFDHEIIFSISQFEWIFKWRTEAEQKMIAIRGQGMSPEEIRKYLQPHMALYELYKRDLDHTKVCAGQRLKITLDENRQVLAGL